MRQEYGYTEGVCTIPNQLTGLQLKAIGDIVGASLGIEALAKCANTDDPNESIEFMLFTKGPSEDGSGYWLGSVEFWQNENSGEWEFTEGQGCCELDDAEEPSGIVYEFLGLLNANEKRPWDPERYDWTAEHIAAELVARFSLDDETLLDDVGYVRDHLCGHDYHDANGCTRRNMTPAEHDEIGSETWYAAWEIFNREKGRGTPNDETKIDV